MPALFMTCRHKHACLWLVTERLLGTPAGWKTIPSRALPGFMAVIDRCWTDKRRCAAARPPGWVC